MPQVIPATQHSTALSVQPSSPGHLSRSAICPASVQSRPRLLSHATTRPGPAAQAAKQQGAAPLHLRTPAPVRKTVFASRASRSRDMTTAAAAAPKANGAASHSKPSVGFLGMGTLGVPMATNLVKAGYTVTVWNRNTAKCDPLRELGAEVASSAKAVAQASDITIACVADPAAALEVAAGPDGASAGMSEGKGYVDVSTIDVGTAQKIAAAIRGAGGRYIEAPVSGSKGPAEQGTLIFLTAGDRELFDEAGPLLEVMGKKSFFLGTDVGLGAKMKLVINMVMGSMMASFAEGLALAESGGLQQSDLIEAMGLGAIAAPMFALKGPTMVKGSFAPAFPLKHQQKDLRLVLELAEQLGQDLPVAAASNNSYLKAMDQGLGDQDFSAVLSAVAKQ
mmetsp:Transcript_6601/g.19038  ORF Transcript_6601/g.19038 Transcript_6601/m.19038 type:complete len:393 (+) Transcript_6601:177-1355(+)